MIPRQYSIPVGIVSVVVILFSAITISAQSIKLTSPDSRELVAAVSNSLKTQSSAISSVPVTNPSCYTFNTDLKKGDRNYSVEALQRLLQLPSITTLIPATNITRKDSAFDPVGFFGNETRSLVMNFQKKYAFSPDGRVDSVTRAQLNKLFGCNTISFTPVQRSISSPVSPILAQKTTTTKSATPTNATPLTGARIIVRHYSIDQTISYHSFITCPKTSQNNQGLFGKFVQYFTPLPALAAIICFDAPDASEVQKGNFDNAGRSDSTWATNWPNITSYRYTKSRNGCYYDSDKSVHGNTYESTFPGNTIFTCNEPGGSMVTDFPYTSQEKKKGGGQSIWYLYGPDPLHPQNTIKVSQITDSIQEDSRADLILDGGDPSAYYIATFGVSAAGIYPASQQGSSDILVNGWFTKPVTCDQITTGPGSYLEWSKSDPYFCTARYVVPGDSITDVTPGVSVPYYAYSLGYGYAVGVNIVLATSTPTVASSSAQTAFAGQYVTFAGMNIPTGGTAVVLLSGNGSMYQITPTVNSSRQFSFTIPGDVAVGTYSLRIRGDDTIPSNSISLTIVPASQVKSLILTQPVEGAVLTAGSPSTITWNSSNVSNVILLLYSEISAKCNSKGGEPTVLAQNIPNTGSYSWTPGNALATAYKGQPVLYCISVADFASSTVISKKTFTIASPSITVTSPTASSAVTAGVPFSIKWTSSGVANVNIDQLEPTDKSSGGYYKYPIATNIANTGSYTWTSPGNLRACKKGGIASQYKVVISDVTASSTINSISELFTANCPVVTSSSTTTPVILTPTVSSTTYTTASTVSPSTAPATSSSSASVTPPPTVIPPAPTPAIQTSLTASLTSASEDKAGAFVFHAGSASGTAKDWNWTATLTLGSSKTIKSMSMSIPGTNNTWSTVTMSNWPLVVFANGVQLNTSYGQTLGTYAAGTPVTFQLYGQIDYRTFKGATLTVSFTDGTSVTTTIPASTITVAAIVSEGQTASVWSVIKGLFILK